MSCVHITNESRDDFDQLIEAIRANECAAWVGSGPSLALGYPSWCRLACLLAYRCGVSDFTSFNPQWPDKAYSESTDDQTKEEFAHNNFLKSAASSRSLDPRADDFFTKLCDEALDASKTQDHSNPRGAFDKVLLELFARPNVTTNDTYKYLSMTCFNCILTTNFDDRLLREVQHHDRLSGNNRFLCFNRPFRVSNANRGALFYLHGLIKERDTSINGIVLCGSEFCQAYGNGEIQSLLQSQIGHFLYTLFQETSICFIGANPRDRGFRFARDAALEVANMQAKKDREAGTKQEPRLRHYYIEPRYGKPDSNNLINTGNQNSQICRIEYTAERHNGFSELRDIAEFVSQQCPIDSRHRPIEYKLSSGP